MLSKLKVAKIESCQSWELPSLKIVKIENRQNWKLPKLKVAIIWMLPIESDLYISAINYSFDIKLKVTKIESCQNWKFQI